jgi:diacylglycerol O-acyltransferase
MRVMPGAVNTVTTNVQGPPQALYAVGRKLIEYLPFVPLSQGVRLGIAILSYNGNLAFGVTGDFDTVPEVEWFCRRIEAGIAELRDRIEPATKPDAMNRARYAKVPA